MNNLDVSLVKAPTEQAAPVVGSTVLVAPAADQYIEEYDPEGLEDFCMTCGGDGWEYDDDLMEEDPIWWEGVQQIPCRNCGGTGRREDQTCW